MNVSIKYSAFVIKGLKLDSVNNKLRLDCKSKARRRNILVTMSYFIPLFAVHLKHLISLYHDFCIKAVTVGYYPSVCFCNTRQFIL